MQKLEDFDTFIQNRKQPKEDKIKLEDFNTFRKTRNQERLDLLLDSVKNGSISAYDAQKEMAAIGNSGIIDQLNFGVNDFENGVIDSLVNIGASGEDIYNFIKRIFNDDIDKQTKFFNNLSSERKEQLVKNPSFMRDIGSDIIPSLATGTFFSAIPAIGSIGKNIASATKSIPGIGKQVQSLLNPVGKLSDLSLQSGLASALGGFEGEKTKDATLGALTGAAFSGAGSLTSKGLEKLLPAKSPKGIANKLLEDTNISRKEFNDLFGKAENQFLKLNSDYQNPLYKYAETKENVLKMLKDNNLYKKELIDFEKEVNANTIDAVKNTIREQTTKKEFPERFTKFFNTFLKKSAEPATRSNYLANQYYRNVNKISDENLQILIALRLKDASESKN